tara:strand:+ start:14304 stop:16058 length:1755 start_codon:yes stop_codon:yes gene_type:complete
MPSSKENISLEDILKKTSLVKYIEHNWQPLKKVGSEYKTLCPFHDDSNPSLSVNDEKGVYYCYSCKAGGNIITFIKDFKNLNSKEAINEIGSFFNIKVSNIKIDFEDNQERKNYLINLNSSVADLYNKFLIKKDVASKAIEYLKSRGFNQQDIETNQIGFAPDSWDFLPSFVKNDKNKLGALEELGLVKKKDETGKYYDFFRNRIIFPIKNRQGIILGFAGRSIDDSTPKYLNSKESIVFSKRKVLYGIDKFNNFKGTKPKFVFLVEGYTDVLMMNKIGIYNTVASMGTSLTLDHASEIKKFSDKIIINFDSDKAGLDAAFKSIEPLFENNFDVYKLNLPDGLDPCDFITSRGKDAFLDLVKQSDSIIDSFIEFSKQQYLDKNISLNNIILDFISKVSCVKDIFNRDLMINKFISAFGLSKNELEKKIIENQNEKDINHSSKEKELTTTIDIILKLLLESKELRSLEIINSIKNHVISNHTEILTLLEENIDSDPSILISISNDNLSKKISDLLFTKIAIDNDIVKQKKMLDDCLIKLKLEDLKERKRRINMRLNYQSELNVDEEKRLLNELQKIIESEKKLKY